MASLPRHVDTDDEQEALVSVEGAQPALRVLRATHFYLLGGGRIMQFWLMSVLCIPFEKTVERVYFVKCRGR